MDAPGQPHGQTARLPVGPRGGAAAGQRVRAIAAVPDSLPGGSGRHDTPSTPHGPGRRYPASPRAAALAPATPTGGPAALTAQALATAGGEGEEARAAITHTALGASLAYRRRGALPPLYAHDPTIFRVKV